MVPSYFVSLNSFFVAILILNFLSFKFGYKKSFLFSLLLLLCNKSFRSSNSFFNKNLLQSFVKKVVSSQFKLLNSSLSWFLFIILAVDLTSFALLFKLFFVLSVSTDVYVVTNSFCWLFNIILYIMNIIYILVIFC